MNSTKPLFDPWVGLDEADLPVRDFIYGKHYIWRFMSVTASPGGLGKLALAIAEAVSMVTGQPILGIEPKRPVKVALFNAEDPKDEIKARVFAACKMHGIGQREIAGRLFIQSGRDLPLILASGGRRNQ